MPALDWLTARPLAHRGLHDASASVIENTASAFAAAIAGGYGIECDLQVSADGEAVVHHDDALGRLTEGSGRLADMNVAEIANVIFHHVGVLASVIRATVSVMRPSDLSPCTNSARADGSVSGSGRSRLTRSCCPSAVTLTASRLRGARLRLPRGRQAHDCHANGHGTKRAR